MPAETARVCGELCAFIQNRGRNTTYVDTLGSLATWRLIGDVGPTTSIGLQVERSSHVDLTSCDGYDALAAGGVEGKVDMVVKASLLTRAVSTATREFSEGTLVVKTGMDWTAISPDDLTVRYNRFARVAMILDPATQASAGQCFSRDDPLILRANQRFTTTHLDGIPEQELHDQHINIRSVVYLVTGSVALIQGFGMLSLLQSLVLLPATVQGMLQYLSDGM